MTFRLKHVEPNLEFRGSVALVGSSNCLLQTKYGNEIDQHDDVVRFNRSPTEGFEEHAGSKTTLRVVNIHVYGNVDAEKEGFSNQPRYFVKKLRNCNIMCIGNAKNLKQKKKDNTHDSTNLFIFKWGHLETLKSQFGCSSGKAPTIGFITVLLCISSGITPDLYGFHDSDGTWGHYWEKRPPAGPCHDIGQEKEIINRLNREGHVRLLK